MTSYLTLKKDIERRLKGAWNFKWFKVTFQLILPFLLPAYSNPEISSNPPRRNPWFWLVVLVIIMMTSSYRDAWRSKWQIIGITPTQLLADDSGRWLVDSQKSPETTRKEILTVGSPFHTNSLLLLTHTYKHSLRLRLPVPLPVGKSTSGWRQIGKKSTSGGGLKMKTIPLATVLLLYLGCHLFSLRKFLLRWLSSRGLANGFTLANVLSGEHQPNPTFLLVSRKTHDFIF